MEKYVAYYRVSTQRQQKSGLGLEAQMSVVDQFVGDKKHIIAEYVEIQSGASDRREQLWRAISHAKKNGAKIIIARLDRFSRKVSFIARIMEAGINLVVAEMPAATDFQLHIFAALAQEERRLISERTRAALAQAKRRGVVLGKNGKSLAIKNRVDMCDRYLTLRQAVGEKWDYLSDKEIMLELNNLGFRRKDGTPWTAYSLSSLRKRVENESFDVKSFTTVGS